MKLKESNRKGKTVGDGWSESSVKRSSTKKIFFSLLTQSMLYVLPVSLLLSERSSSHSMYVLLLM